MMGQVEIGEQNFKDPNFLMIDLDLVSDPDLSQCSAISSEHKKKVE
jgi:hypothetical protein